MRGNGWSATRSSRTGCHKLTVVLFGSLAVIFCLAAPSILADDPLPETVFCLTETPERIKTPPGSGMGKKEYPFDEEGDYRKDWVDPRSRSSEKRSTTVRPAIPPDSPEHSLVQARKKIEEEKAARELVARKEKSPPSQSRKPGAQTPKLQLDLANSIKPVFQGRHVPAAHLTSKRNDSMEAILTRIPLGKPQPRKIRPVSGSPIAATPVNQTESILHKVGKGDTLWSLSQRYKTTVPRLQQANGLTSNLIRIGQILRIR